MTVRELTHKADSREIAEWVAYLDEYDRSSADWVQTAQICATMVNVARVVGSRKVPKKADVEDFMPQKRKVAQSQAQMKEMLKSLTGG